MKRILYIAIVFLFSAFQAWCACTGSSPSWISTPDRTSVASCVSQASDGDTITVTQGGGAETWSTPVIIDSKSISVIGPGTQSGGWPLTITANSGAFDLRSTVCGDNESRVSGFRVNTTNLGLANFVPDYGCVPTGWRIDNMYFYMTSGTNYCLDGYGSADAYPTGLIDQSDFYNCGTKFWGGYSSASANSGSVSWNAPLGLGTDDAVYVEDCNFTFDSAQWGATEAHHGGRHVVRFSKITGNAYLGNHGIQGGNQRGTRLWEFYENELDGNGTGFRPFLIRAGTGVVFSNDITGNYNLEAIYIDEQRSSPECSPRPRPCDGTDWYDSNEEPDGWLCRDQIGASTDASLWDMSQPAPAQQKQGSYQWSNRKSITVINFAKNCSSATLDENRDYYNEDTSFDGTTGVGVGTLANRPLTCTAGVAYWATDQGEWNSNQPGNDGSLYECESTNTWALYYTPYTYPHPLRGAAPTSPAKITGVKIISGN